MPKVHQFHVSPCLSERLCCLNDLSLNLRWSWDDRARDLFRWLDPDGWEESRHDPVRVLSHVSHARLGELQSDLDRISSGGSQAGKSAAGVD